MPIFIEAGLVRKLGDFVSAAKSGAAAMAVLVRPTLFRKARRLAVMVCDPMRRNSGRKARIRARPRVASAFRAANLRYVRESVACPGSGWQSEQECRYARRHRPRG